MADKYRLIEEEGDQVLSEQVLLAYRQLPVTVISSFILAALVVWVTYNTIPTAYLGIWLGIIIIFGLIRMIAMKKVHIISFDHDKIRTYAWFHIATTAVSGITWGTIAFALPMLSPQQQTLTLIILAGLISGATVSSAALTASYLGFILPVMLFVNTAVMMIGGSFGYILLIAFTSYTIFLVFAGRRIHQTLLSNVKMRLDQQELNNQISKERQRFEKVLNASPAGTLLAGPDGKIVYVNNELCRLFDYTSEELIGQEIELLVPEKYRDQHIKDRDQFTREGNARKMGRGMMLRGQRKNGSTLPLEIGLQPITLLDEQLQIVTLMDLTEQAGFLEKIKEQADQLRALSLTDELTNTGNRRAFNTKLNEYVDLSFRSHVPVSLMILDIDHFKEYNDSFGHVEGDKALQQVATLLNKESRSIDFVSRYGGEEFTVIMPDTNRDDALYLAERIRTAVGGYPWDLRPLTISIGISTTHELTGKAIELDKAVDSLIRLADEALYQSKSDGRNKVSAL
jgi:diguanylate cyclase (GGDEF)-like protein/PAS domain S-box-containing protein